MEFGIISEVSPTKWRNHNSLYHFIAAINEMEQPKDGVHQVVHLRASVCEVDQSAGGDYELEGFVCGAHEMVVKVAAVGIVPHMHWLCWEVGDTWKGSQDHYKRVVGRGPHAQLKGTCGVNVEENLNRSDKHHIAAHLFHKPTRVLTPHGTLVDVFSFYRPETYTFHLPWGECMITLEDVAMQLGLPVDGQPVSGILRDNIKLKWLRTRLQQMPLDLEDNGLMQYACCYKLYLLGGMLLPDKANNTMHVRYLPLLADYEAICTYSWGSTVLCWLYRAILPFWAPNVTTPYSFPLATRWVGKKGQNDNAEQRLLRHRLRLDNLQVDEFVFGNRTWTPGFSLEFWLNSSATHMEIFIQPL
ncbi:uncharacterized protein DS421_5g164310 [Arachis hypogaea]|nr:uncharacterized protein DS421_5g164310 [Arachis hypogaea]